MRQHHERFNGKGYPEGLAGEAITLGARILAVADVYDALSSERPYRKAMDPDEALHIIEENSGSHFDPAVVEAFFKVLEEDRKLRPFAGQITSHARFGELRKASPMR